MTRGWRRAAIATTVLCFFVAGLVVTLLLVRRARTGEWQLPNRDDIQAVREGAARTAKKVKDRVVPPKPVIARTIFLNGSGAQLTAGKDDSTRGVSSVVASGTKKNVTVPKWSGSKRSWAKLLACVREQFRPFNVEVIDVRPSHDNFVMAMVGGRVRDIGVTSMHAGGLAPFNGKVIPKPIVFAFSRTLRNRVQAICETLAMEIAHAYGLDHAYYCPDVMTYLRGCGKKRFRDKTVRCGENKKRDCADGEPTQNSVQGLLKLLGSAQPAENKTKP